MKDLVIEAGLRLLRRVGRGALAGAMERRFRSWSEEGRRRVGERLARAGQGLAEGRAAQAADLLAELVMEAR